MSGIVRCIVAAAAATACWAAAAAEVPDLDAVVRYETRELLPNGVARQEQWAERLVRRGERVWTERLGPDGRPFAPPHEAEHGGAEHRHFDFDSAARLAWRDAKGEVQVQYVDRQHRQVVNVPKAEWSAAGFDGRLDAAAHLLPPALVAQMRKESAGPAGTEWRVRQAQGWTHRVQWSPARQVALRIESKRDDGGVSRTVTLVPQTAGAALPWQQIDGYQRLEYDDFMD